MCNSQAICTIDTYLSDFSTPKIVSEKSKSDFGNVPLLVNFAKWNNNEK